VAKTGDIKDLIITEEGGIAKGIRRIIAITGEDAHAASREANALDARLDQIDRSSGSEKEAGLKAFSVVRNLDQLGMSAVD